MIQDPDLLETLFLRSFERFLVAEADNILIGTSERNLCARLAFLLEDEASAAGLVEYYADVEYNRKQRGLVKTILDDHAKVIPITSDLIFHSRGAFIVGDNLITVEMKRSEHREEEKQKDRDRLRAMTKPSFDDIWSGDGKTHPEHVCGYVLGYFLELDAAERRFLIEEYRCGEFFGERKMPF